MAYFANSTEGDILDRQCSLCIFGEESCPVFLAQFGYNYDAIGNEVATNILNTLVNEEGICQMRDTFKRQLATDGSKQGELFTQNVNHKT